MQMRPDQKRGGAAGVSDYLPETGLRKAADTIPSNGFG
jgi:hypothetical protein